MNEDYFSELLVGAEDWAIDQIREQFQKTEEKLRDLQYLKVLVKQLVDMLESTEISDSENEFHPTVIRSCRVQDTQKLNEIMPKISKIVKEEN